MFVKIEFTYSLSILMLYFSFSNAQNPSQNINAYKYIKESPSSKDSFKVKEGHWVEEEVYTDSLFTAYDYPSDGGTSKDGGKVKRAIEIGIVTSKGNYLDNMKNGTWQYFDWHNRLYKEVDYIHGHIQSVKYYDSNGYISLYAGCKASKFNSINDIFHLEKYDGAGKKISEEDVPGKLIYSGLSVPY